MLLCIEGRLTELRARQGTSSYDLDLSFRSRQGPQRLRRVHVPPLLAPLIAQGREGRFCFQTVCGHATLYGVRFGDGSHMADAVLPRGMALHFALAALLSVMAALSPALLHLPSLTCLLAMMALYHLAHVLLDNTARARTLLGPGTEPNPLTGHSPSPQAA